MPGGVFPRRYELCLTVPGAKATSARLSGLVHSCSPSVARATPLDAALGSGLQVFGGVEGIVPVDLSTCVFPRLECEADLRAQLPDPVICGAVSKKEGAHRERVLDVYRPFLLDHASVSPTATEQPATFAGVAQ